LKTQFFFCLAVIIANQNVCKNWQGSEIVCDDGGCGPLIIATLAKIHCLQGYKSKGLLVWGKNYAIPSGNLNKNQNKQGKSLLNS